MRFLQLFKQKLQVFNAVSYQYQLRAKKGQTIYRSTRYFEWASGSCPLLKADTCDAPYGCAVPFGASCLLN